jgi:cytidylate kinase
MLSNHVVGLSGRLGSGKSSLASILAERSGWPKAAFGDYLRYLAEQRGLGVDRQSLQHLGEEQIVLGWDGFCLAVLNHFKWRPGQGLVVDGIRHITAVSTLNRLICPQSVFLVHLAIDEEIRQNRLTIRDGKQAQWRKAENHSTEADVKEALPNAADMIVDATLPVDVLADKVLDALEPFASRQHPRPSLAGVHVPYLSAMYRSELN